MGHIFSFNIVDVEGIPNELSRRLGIDGGHIGQLISGVDGICNPRCLELVALRLSPFDITDVEIVGTDVLILHHVAVGYGFDIGRIGIVLFLNLFRNLLFRLGSGNIIPLEGRLSDLML